MQPLEKKYHYFVEKLLEKRRITPHAVLYALVNYQYELSLVEIRGNIYIMKIIGIEKKDSFLLSHLWFTLYSHEYSHKLILRNNTWARIKLSPRCSF